MLKQAVTIDNAQIFPGNLVATETKYAGRALPKGIVAGVSVYMTDEERLRMIHLFNIGAARALSTWDIALPVVPN